MVGVIDQVTLGFVVLTLLVNLIFFVIFFGYFSHIQEEISTASHNFQASNTAIAEAIVSLGTLLDDLDEVSGDLVRPPAIGDVLAQGLQMFMFSKLQGMLPPEISPMFNNQRIPDPEAWQDVKPNVVDVQNTKGHSN